MKVKDMMHKGAEYVAPTAKLQTIAKKMRDHDIGAMLVCEDGKTVGMVTDRDIAIRAFTNGKNLPAIEAQHAMSRNVVSCRAHLEAEDALRPTEKTKMRRLPALTQDGQL